MATSGLRQILAMFLLFTCGNHAFLPSTSTCRLPLPHVDCTCFMTSHPVLVCAGLRLNKWPDLTVLGNVSIDRLDLSRNSFRGLPRDAFGNLEISSLVLSRNSIPFTGSARVFNEVQRGSLTSLDLSNNNLTEIPRFVRNLPKLTHLRLRGNHFAHIESSDLTRLPSLTHLHLPAVYKLDKNALKDVDDLRLLEISPYSFSLEREGLNTFFTKKIASKLRYVETLVLKSGWFHLKDTFLSNLRSLEYLEISDADLDDSNFNSPKLRDEYGDLKVLKLDGNTLQSVPRKFLSRLGALEELTLARNQLREIRNKDFKKNPLLRILDLSRNSIVQIKSSAFRHLAFLTDLDLRHNHVTHVRPRMFPAQLMTDLTLHLGYNSWECSCDNWWLTQLAHEQLQGRAGPLVPYEIANDIRCGSPNGSNRPNGTLLYKLYYITETGCVGNTRSRTRNN